MASSNTGSPFTQASQSAKALGARFDEITAVIATLTTGGTTGSVAHGLSATPDFAVCSLNSTVALGAEKSDVSWTATGTTITVITSNTNAADRTVSILAGVVA